LNITSRSIGEKFRTQQVWDPTGTIGVEFTYTTPRGKITFDPNNVESADVAPVSTSLLVQNDGCNQSG